MTFNNANQTGDVENGKSSETVQAAWSDSESPSTAVVETIATATGQDPLEMPCLYDTLDVDALDSLLTSDRTEVGGNVSISFRYDGMFIRVDSGGGIEFDPDPKR